MGIARQSRANSCGVARDHRWAQTPKPGFPAKSLAPPESRSLISETSITNAIATQRV